MYSTKQAMAVTLLSAAVVSAAVSAVWAATVGIDQVGQKFSQAAVILNPGDHILFLNQDDVKHNIKVVDPNGVEDEKGLQAPGETIDVAFARTGQFTVRCMIHPKMKLAVTVR